jgi:hypothetical protein
MFHLFLRSSATAEHCVEASGQLLSQRAEPQLAEDQEPGFRQDVTAMPRDWGSDLGP